MRHTCRCVATLLGLQRSTQMLSCSSWYSSRHAPPLRRILRGILRSSPQQDPSCRQPRVPLALARGLWPELAVADASGSGTACFPRSAWTPQPLVVHPGAGNQAMLWFARIVWPSRAARLQCSCMSVPPMCAPTPTEPGGCSGQQFTVTHLLTLRGQFFLSRAHQTAPGNNVQQSTVHTAQLSHLGVTRVSVCPECGP